MQIVLLGYMGSGKTTIGKLLSEKLKTNFLDLDTYIEEVEGVDISTIFQEKGEIYFRKKEAESLRQVLASKENFVLSIGGGTPCYANNMNAISEMTEYGIYLKVGITDLDERVAKILRKMAKKVYVIANKVDSPIHQTMSAEFYSLGLGEVYNLSSINGSGTGEILDVVVAEFEEKPEFEDTSGVPKFAIVGKPNVGKSSLINALIGQERNIVTDISGTTRDTLNTRYKSYGFDFFLVDTAGLRKQAKIQEDIEFYSTLRSVRAIEESDVCIFMIDAIEGIGQQDLNVFQIIKKNKKGVVVLINKWDLVDEKETNTIKEMEELVRKRLAPFTDVPIIFTSTVTKQRLHKALEKSIQVYENRTQKITTSELNDKLLPIIERTPPPAYKGKYIKIKFVTQLPTYTPSFAIFCNLPQYIREDYKRFVENQLRKLYNFEGVPMNIFFRKKN